MKTLPISIHVDVDGLDIYEQEYGSPAAVPRQAIFDQALPLMLDLFDGFGIRATFFIIGRDLEDSAGQRFVAKLLERGHEVANHTWSHAPNFHAFAKDEQEREIVTTEERLFTQTGQRPVGFRAPGYYLNHHILNMLKTRGYRYDSSVLPTWTHALMRVYLRLRGQGRKIDKAVGRIRYALVNQQPTILFPTAQRPLYEIPIATMPLLRLPIHSTFLFLYGLRWARWAMNLQRKIGKGRVFLLHAIDTLAYPISDYLSRAVPTLRMPLEQRLVLLKQTFSTMQNYPGFISTPELLAELDRKKVPQAKLLFLGNPQPANHVTQLKEQT